MNLRDAIAMAGSRTARNELATGFDLVLAAAKRELEREEAAKPLMSSEDVTLALEVCAKAKADEHLIVDAFVMRQAAADRRLVRTEVVPYLREMAHGGPVPYWSDRARKLLEKLAP